MSIIQCSSFICLILTLIFGFAINLYVVCVFRVTSDLAGMDSEKISVAIAFSNRDTKYEIENMICRCFRHGCDLTVWIGGMKKMKSKNLLVSSIHCGKWQGTAVGASIQSNFRLYVKRNVKHWTHSFQSQREINGEKYRSEK